MNPPSHQKAPYITRPADHMAEGEIKVAGTGPEADDRIMAFVMALFRAALDEGSGTAAPSEISSLSLERLGPLRERIYGQAYLERRGTTVQFLRVRLFNGQGEPVLSGMATSHVSHH